MPIDYPNLDFHLGESDDLLVETVHSFEQNEIAP